MYSLINLPIDILNHIFEMCDYDSLKNIYKVNKFFRNNKNKNLLFTKLKQKRRVKKLNILNNNFPIFFMNIINYESLLKAEEFKIKQSRMNFSGYIDFLEYQDFYRRNTNILYGKDNYGRFFISIIYDVDNSIFHNSSNYNIVTLFQRYVENKYHYVYAGNYFYNGFINTCSFDNFSNKFDNHFEIFIQLLNFKKACFFHENIIINYKLSTI